MPCVTINIPITPTAKLELGLISGEPTLRLEKGGMSWSFYRNSATM